MKLLLFVVACIGFYSVPAFSENVFGTFNGKSYDFQLVESTGNIYGHYGDIKSDFYVVESTGNIYGNIGGQSVNIYVTASTNNVWGTSACGNTNYYFVISTNNLYGNVCGRSVNEYFQSEEMLKDAASHYLSEVLGLSSDVIPKPIRRSVSKFVRARVSLK